MSSPLSAVTASDLTYVARVITASSILQTYIGRIHISLMQMAKIGTVIVITFAIDKLILGLSLNRSYCTSKVDLRYSIDRGHESCSRILINVQPTDEFL
jgi:hypothetical protein